MQSTNYAYVNGRFVPEAEATVSIFDRGFLYGDGVFETMRVYQSRIFRVFEHVTRLVSGITLLGIELEESSGFLRGVCEEIVRHNKVIDGMVRIYVTRGLGNIGLSAKKTGRPTVIAVAQERQFSTEADALRLVLASLRVDSDSRLTRVKSANRLCYLLAKQEAEQRMADDAILLNNANHAVELTASNLFLYREGKLVTPPLVDGALPGITRAIVLTLAVQAGIDTAESSIELDTLRHAEESFATNSLFEISPIAMIEGHQMSERRITGRLQEVFRDHVREELGLD
ncbi:MAG TPA: aminotransferase class IV [Verrucomicrobiae bacterium]|nr:aminotransferase class IV [Verrucomicrobiae bacterium]